MAFLKRISAPNWYNPRWVNVGYGGYNRCMVRDNGIVSVKGTVVPNCTGYAWGRFLEILDATDCNLSTGNAGNWYSYTKDGYSRGTVPALGAVICFSNPGKAGHVAIVEEINEDGSIVISESGYSSRSPFWTSTQFPPNYYHSPYQFQGFIYAPGYEPNTLSNKLVQFINIANSIVGKDCYWVWKNSGLSQGQPWCVATIIAVAKIVGGLIDVIIPLTYSTSAMSRLGVANGYGTWLPGPYQGVITQPQVGDFVTFRWYSPSVYKNDDKYTADHIEIVVEVADNGSSFRTVAGNSGSGNTYTRKVKYNDHNTNSSAINGYYRPNWSTVGGAYYGYSSQLYEFQNTRADATLREIGYINQHGEPSIQVSNNSTSYPLSVINFTPMVGALYSLIAPALGITAGQVGIIDNLNSTAQAIVQYLTNKGLPVSSAIGILANCYEESRLDLSAVGDNGNSYGLFQWNEAAGRYMRRYVGATWRTNLTGQMDFLWQELNSSFSSLLSKLYKFPNTEYGAREAAKAFMLDFERPSDQSQRAQEGRADVASGYWKQIAIQTVSEVVV